MKRKLNDTNICHYKRLRKNIPFSKDSWICPSQLKNYIYNDCIIDWLKLYGKNYNINTFNSFIINKGIEFEKQIINLIKTLHPDLSFIQISFSGLDVVNPQKSIDTENAIKNGIHIIYQGVLHNPSNQTYGSPDLIIRSDIIDKIIPNTLTKKQSIFKAPRLSSNYHYRIIDIKFMTLPLKSDGKHILNSNNIPFCKVQSILYNYALGYIQGYIPSQSYLLGRGYNYKSKGYIFSNDSCFEKLGIIDINGKDNNYKQTLTDAIDWIYDLKKNGHNWNIYPIPSVIELYPNMCNKYDYSYHDIKKEIAHHLKDITCIWQCGPKNRSKAFEYDIYSWDDPRLTSRILGHNGNIIGPLVQKILDFNRSSDNKIISITKISNNTFNWKQKSGIHFFLDFETISNIFDDFSMLPHIGGINLISIIGVKYFDYSSNQSGFKHFYLKDLTHDSEFSMLSSFINWISPLINTHNNHILYHWSNAEKIHIKSITSRHPSLVIPTFNYFDVLELFKSEPILIKGVFDFSLKSVINGLSKFNLISINWPSSCSNGLQAMLTIWECYHQHVDVSTLSKFQDVLLYNSLDCESIFKIIDFLRNNFI